MYDVFGLGNAIVDTEIRVDEGFLTRYGIAKGHMTLVDSDHLRTLLDALDGLPKTQSSGGSAANTIFALQSLGYNTGYGCKVADDPTGQFFIEHMAQCGVNVNTSDPVANAQSGQCLILITADAERTMNTDLGISADLSIEDIDLQRLAGARYFYAEGYLSSSPASSAAVAACRAAGQESGVATAISLSDPSMVEIFRDPLTEMLGNGVELIFCNEEEALSWAKTDRLDLAIAELKDIAPEIYITLGAKGSIAVERGHASEVAGVPVKAIDTTGAGDLYAGACLAARLSGAQPSEAARFANFCAAEIVTRYGARLGEPSAYAALRHRYSD